MEEGKNRLNNVGWLMLLVIAALLLLHFLPKIQIGERSLRQVDILADVMKKSAATEVDSISIDSLLPPPPKPVFVDTCKTGITCIEDYGDSTLRGMTPFYRAIDESALRPRPIRIAYFGDSFIEGDIMTVDLRQLLQETYGGHGVGYVSISSAISGYRNSVRHRASGWSNHALTDSVYFNRRFQDISNHYFFAREEATVDLTGTQQYARLDTCQQSSLFFVSKDTVTISASINGRWVKTQTYDSIGHLSAMHVEGRIGRVRWNVQQADSSLFYGVTMDDTVGIALDNFSLRGSAGLNIRSVPMAILRQYAQLRPYDLIVLQYGVNVATKRGVDYSSYVQGMKTVIQHLKDAFPDAGILIVGVADRDYVNDEGEILTMPGIRNLVRFQQQLAIDEGVAFWNMFEAMGGNESMKALVEQRPALAAFDYTHLNFRGGKYLATLLFDAIQYGKERYDRRRAYEEE